MPLDEISMTGHCQYMINSTDYVSFKQYWLLGLCKQSQTVTLPIYHFYSSYKIHFVNKELVTHLIP